MVSWQKFLNCQISFEDRVVGAGFTLTPNIESRHFYGLNSAEHERFSANKYENANYRCWLFHFY